MKIYLRYLLLLVIISFLSNCTQNQHGTETNTVTDHITVATSPSPDTSIISLLNNANIYGDPCELLSMQLVNHTFHPSVPPQIENKRNAGFNYCKYQWKDAAQNNYTISLAIGKSKVADSLLTNTESQISWIADSNYFQLNLNPPNADQIKSVFEALSGHN